MKIEAWFVSALRVTDVSKFDQSGKKSFGHRKLLEDLSSFMIANLRFLLTTSQRRHKQKRGLLILRL